MDSQIIYSNSSFMTLCHNNLHDIGQRMINVKKLAIYKTEKNLNDMDTRKSKSFIDDTKQIFFNEEPKKHDINNMPNSFHDLNDLLEEVIFYTSSGYLSDDDYLIFKAKFRPIEGSGSQFKSYEVKISPLLNYKKVILIFTDTSQKDKVISLEGVNQYKDKLLATVSHDLRAPINGTLTFLENALENHVVPLDVKRDSLIPAQRSCQFLLHLVNDILDYSQINVQKLRMSFDRLSIRETLTNCHQLLQVQASIKKISFPIVLDERLPQVFTTDHNRLSQIIINLLTNALKFTSKGEVKLTATIISPFSIEIQVNDTGIGIKEEDLKKLFNEFPKIDYEQPNINTRGVGLGLVIANQLARLLGPKDSEEAGIKVESVYGRGSTFSFIIRDKNIQREKSLKEDKRARMSGASIYFSFDHSGHRKSKTNSQLMNGYSHTKTGEISSVDHMNTIVHIPL